MAKQTSSTRPSALLGVVRKPFGISFYQLIDVVICVVSLV